MQKKSFALFPLLLLALPLSAQKPPAPVASAPITQITLGQSIVPLNGPWKFHIGDNPAWADPSFDDSQWETVDLTPKQGSFDPDSGFRGYSPGWTAKGHPGYAGFAWYRIRIQITGADRPLALLAPSNVDDAYQVFANGRLLGGLGKFPQSGNPAPYATRPRMFPLPQAGSRDDQPGAITQVLAFRIYMAPRDLLFPLAGGMHTPPIVGLASGITAAYHVAWENRFRETSYALLTAVLCVAFAFLVWMLLLFDRTETVLLWPLGGYVAGALIYMLIFSSFTTDLVNVQQNLVLRAFLIPAVQGLWLVTWWAYCGLQNRRWLRNAIGIWALWRFATYLVLELLLLNGRPPHWIFAVRLANNFAIALVDVILLILIVYFGWRHPQRETWALFLAILFFAIIPLLSVLDWLHIRTIWFPFGIRLNLGLIARFFSWVCFSFVLLRHFRSSQRRQQAIEDDVKQAREVQQVLIPEALPHVPGLTIESEYRPAREVGGDFFQIIPNATDGSVLIVAGDVAGHGLQAGMLVALIVGAIRTSVDTSFDPLGVLQTLNKRLCGRSAAHATCLALRIARDGAVTLANAGHMPPYLNGKELPMPGALPLGMMEGAEFSLMQFQLNEGDRLMLLSDGVAEAQDAAGKLFGFERIEAILQKPITAAEVATAAQNFGQQDDISVLSITRVAVAETVGV